DASDDPGLSQREQVVVALLIAAMLVKAITVVGVLIQPVSLDHGAHRAIQDQDALFEQAVQESGAIVRHINKNTRTLARRVIDLPRALAIFVKRPQAAIKSAQATER